MFKKKFVLPIVKKVSVNQLLAKILCMVLIANLLAVSIPAAPQVIVGTVSELSQDARFAFLSGKMAIDFPNLFAAFFGSRLNSTSTTTNNASRIQIFPGSVTVQQGEQITFSAVGYDTDDAPVSGIDFRWRVADTGRGLAARPLNNGKFEAQVIGTFTITAEGGGRQAQAVITVTPSVAGTPSQPGLQAVTPINISSRSTSKESPKGNETNTATGFGFKFNRQYNARS